LSRETVSSPAKETTRHTGRILVIDDEENIRSTLEEFLSLTGYQVDTAATGAEGLDHLGAASYDLVLSDLKMPDLDGLELLTRIKEDPALSPIPFMVTSTCLAPFNSPLIVLAVAIPRSL